MKVDKVMGQHAFYDDAGPIWTGDLFDAELMRKIRPVNKFVEMLKSEAMIRTMFFFDVHQICKKNIMRIPKKSLILDRIRSKGFKAAETHFSVQGIKTDMPEDDLIEILRSCQ